VISTPAVTELLSELREREIAIAAPDGRLRVRPSAALTPALRARLSASKAELLMLLASADALSVAPAPPEAEDQPAIPGDEDVRANLPPAPTEAPPVGRPAFPQLGQRWMVRDPDPWGVRTPRTLVIVERIIVDQLRYRYLIKGGEIGGGLIATFRERFTGPVEDDE
jgi:hypothetical protein